MARLQRTKSASELNQFENSCMVVYRSTGLGVYGAIMRYIGMPLEKIAIIMNSSQVSSASSDLTRLQMSFRLTFQDGALAPFKVVGRASIVAWFMQYSVMGFVFQVCDTFLSGVFGVPRVAYGTELMLPPTSKPDTASSAASSIAVLSATKMVLAPMMSGSIESIVANRAEAQRYFGLDKFAKLEAKVSKNAVQRLCGPAFMANASRNFIMSSTSFVLTPITFKNLYPQEKKSKQSLFWFGLGMNIFIGNTIAITQQALWGRALDYMAVGGGRPINYPAVVREGLKSEGTAAFYTPAKWFTRVLMNAPVQGTLPWFYNQILPMFEGPVLRAAQRAQGSS